MTAIRMTLILLALALAGCGSTYSASAVRDADARAQAIYAECDAQLRAGTLTSYRQAADCAEPRVLSVYQQNGYPYMDLVLLELKARATGAEHIDAGSAAPADVQRDILTLEQRIATERQRRRQGEMVAGGSAPFLPPERLLAGLDTLSNRQLPSGTSCFAVGSFTHCN